MDKLDRYTDGEERKLRRKIRAIYRAAGKKAQGKAEAFAAPFRAESERRLQQAEAGEITKAEYRAWLQGQVFSGPEWEKAAAEIAQIYVDADRDARAVTGTVSQETFGVALDYTAEAVKKGAPAAARGTIAFDIYDKRTVQRLIEENPQLLPEWKIDEEKDYTWNYRRVHSTVTQGIVGGESVQRVAERLTGELAAKNAQKMELFARTALTGAHNAGRVERLKETEAMGVRVLKKWLAVHDARTRDAHAKLDGKTAEPDEPFKSDLGPIQYPGDPTANPANVYNCRCTLVYVYPDFE